MSDQIRSHKVLIVVAHDMVNDTLAGASLDVIGDRDDDPRWQHKMVPSSTHAAKSGSQYPEWMLGMFKGKKPVPQGESDEAVK